MATIGTQPNRTDGARRAGWGWALLGTIALFAVVCALAWALDPEFVFNRSLYRDRQRISEFAGSHAGIELGASASRQFQMLVDSARLDDARDEFSGPLDRWWRTPDALARELVFRIARPGDLELLLAAVRAESVRDDANAAIRLISTLESTEAAEAIADTLWSDPALAVMLGDCTMSIPARDTAIAWGAPACNAIAQEEDAAAVRWMEVNARQCCINELRNICSRASCLRALIGRTDLNSRWASSMTKRSAAERPAVERLALAKVSAQAAAITLSSIAEARLAAIGKVQEACARMSPVRISAFLDSFAGPFDTPRSIYDSITEGTRAVVKERLQIYVLGPALIDELPAGIHDVHAGTVDAIRRRIVDECDSDVKISRSAMPLREGDPPETHTEIGNLMPVTAVDLVAGTAAVMDAALVAAVALELAPEPTGATKVAGILVAVGDMSWQLTQVTTGLQRRAEQAAFLHNGVARGWIGTTGLANDLTLPDGTVIDRAHPSRSGVLADAERKAFEHLRGIIQERMKP